MSQYNLTDNVNETFEFVVNDIHYVMRYPLVEEIEKLQDLVEKNKEALDRGDPKEVAKLQEFMYSFISPKEKDSPSIGDTLKKQNVRVLQNFNTMIKTELGIDQ